MPVKTGLDVLVDRKGGRWRGKKAGLILHQASVTRDLRPALDALRGAGVRVVALFAPEHGLAGTLQDQVAVGMERDAISGRPVHSLYGKKLSPSPEHLKGLDVLMFDLQDIGVRYYTFIWTMALAMRAAAKAGLPFVVLDRPNPLGGTRLEGNMLDPSFASFVGLFPLPVRHGMTCGELALYFNEIHGFGTDLHVVRLRGWNRSDWFDRTGLPWVMPSPNMPTLDTAAVYAGSCLFEATNLSEGRGTTRPFEILGAPFVDSLRLRRETEKWNLPGVRFRNCSFRPTFNKWAGQTCHGIQLHVTDRERFRPYLTGLALLAAFRRLFPKFFRWRPPPYEYEKIKLPIDILCGTDRVRRGLETGTAPSRLESGWTPELREFARARRRFLLY
jgi:uncharacterized protein YbbC (DUF1343 family)